MATYLNNPNFQSYQFRPYELPVEQIAKSIASRSSQWELAADQVRDAYQQAAGLTLSRGESKETLKQLMTQADDQLRKDVRSDLSIGENRTRALNAFKPIYQDQRLMTDHAITDFYTKQGQMAEATKVRDGGKEFSQTNFNYMQEKYRDFMEDPNYDVNSLQKHFNEKRGYTPYYNYNTEFDNIVKNCKPDSFSSQGIANDKNGNASLYFDVKSSKTLSSAKLNGCLQSSLSDRAKTQMGIEGYMSYGKNYQGLATDYIRHSDEELTGLNQLKSITDGRLAGLRAKTNPTDAERLEIAQLEQSSNQYGQYINEQVKTRDVVAGGNLDFVRENYERLAAPLYMKRKLNDFSNYYQHTDETRKLEENNAAMLQYRSQQDLNILSERFKQERSMSNLNFSQDLFIENLRQQGMMNRELLQQSRNSTGGNGTRMKRIPNGDGTFTLVPDYPDAMPSLTEENSSTNSIKLVEDRLSSAVAIKDDADNFLYNKFRNQFPEFNNSKDLIASSKFQNYMKANPNDTYIKAWLNAGDGANREMTRLQYLKESVNETLKQTRPDLFQDDLSGLETITLPNGEGLSPQRIVNAIKGLDPELQIKTELNSISMPSLGGGSSGSASGLNRVKTTITYRGQQFTLQNAPPALNRIMARSSQQAQSINEARGALYSNKILEVEGRKDIGADNEDKKNTFKNRLAAGTGLDTDQVLLQQSNLTGDVWVQFVDKPNKPVPEEILKNLQAGYKVTKDGEKYKFSNVQEYSIYSGNNLHYRDMLLDINAAMFINRAKLARNEPVEMPIKTTSDTQAGSPYASFKLIIENGPGGSKLFSIAHRDAEGNYVKSPDVVGSEVEALKTIEMLDKTQQR